MKNILGRKIVILKPAYEFGFGLSYTDFEYGAVVLSNEIFTDSIQAKVTIRNIGKFAGKEAVQLYLTAQSGKLKKPAKELKAFAKTRELQPGESQELTFTLRVMDLASFDDDKAKWIAESGKYQVSIAASSRDVRSNAIFSLEEDVEVTGQLVDLSPAKNPDILSP